MPRSPLYRLPDGTWIDLFNVEMIEPLPAEIHKYAPKYNTGPRVHIIHTEGHIMLDFDTMGCAIEFADTLAALINKARGGEET